jgi:fructan beta-fructosidase
VYVDGEYHLFYQHHPYSLVWGPMHWGHAVSRDLTHWEHLPIALAPDALGAIFSGSVVVDHRNSAGFGAGALVALFTHNGAERQVQSLAFSLDRGRTWTKYAGNPVLAPADAPRDFRDPRVFWYETERGGHWVMLLAVREEVWIYTSADLKAWRKASAFGAGYGAHSGVWECPELVCLPVVNSAERRWALVVGVLQGGPAGGSGTQYFVGDFDGTTFRCDDPPEQVRWADYGADFYAAQAWTHAPDGRAIWLAWMNNWAYARATPATTWRGMMTAPRELSLAPGPDGLALRQRIARELLVERREAVTRRQVLFGPGTLRLEDLRGAALEVRVVFQTEQAAAGSFGLRLRTADDDAAVIRYTVARREIAVERPGAVFHPAGFAGRQAAVFVPQDGAVTLHVLVDAASVELFADDGRIVLTSQLLPAPGDVTVELFAEGGVVALETLQAWLLGGTMTAAGPQGEPAA